MTSATVQDSPITTASLSWTAPATNGGLPITGYVVEWWEGGSLPEKQIVTFTDDYPEFDSTTTRVTTPTDYKTFKLTYGPTPGVKAQSADIPYVINPANLRAALIDLGRDTAANSWNHLNIVGDVKVSKSNVVNAGVAFTVTFISDTNTGDLPLMGSTITAAATSTAVTVTELEAGRREFGQSEVQIITLLEPDVGGLAATDLTGYFKLSFNGTETQTAWLAAGTSNTDLERALEQLPNLRDVTVTRNTYNTGATLAGSVGYEWFVTFSGDKGNQPVITIDASKVSGSQTVTATVNDGDNAIDAGTLDKKTNAIPGELAVGYNSRTVGADTFSYTLSGLVPGKEYFASISAVTARGIGAPMLPSSTSVTPPKQIPQQPQNVAVAVHEGSSTTLDVSYDAPTSDGGTDITSYRIEVDTSVDFTNPIHNTVYCDAGSTHSVFEIKTTATAGDNIVGGYFDLDVTYNGNSYTTAAIPYNAAAQFADEVGLWSKVAGVTATTATVLGTGNAKVVTFGSDISALIFKGDTLQFGSDSTGTFVSHLDEALATNTVDTVDSTTQITLIEDILRAAGSISTNVFRLQGGRGEAAESGVACFLEYDHSTGTGTGPYATDIRGGYCPVTSPGRLTQSGSMQSKFELIPDLLSVGVRVDRDKPDDQNGVTWRVTFLDDSLAGNLNFGVALNSNNLITQTGYNGAASGATGSISVTEKVAGQKYTASCVGTQEVPMSGALVSGQYYWARVFAVNALGMSVAQVSPSSEKPMVVPGAPTAVTLEVVSDTRLRVVFNPPSSDGGDAVTSYKIEYSTDSSFATKSEDLFTTLSGGAPFSRTLSGLTTGSFYFVRVGACNSRGCSTPTASTPSSLNPHRAPDGPINVFLRATSHSMLTVSFEGGYNGGDTLANYRVEWDTTGSFNSGSASPHKGFVDLSAASYNSYTVQSLTNNQQYYVRVMASNSAGLSVATIASPASSAPTLQVPGKPHSISAVTGAATGDIDVTWQRPRVPWHLIPCSGTVASPNDCPTETGGSVASSDGGSAITEYVIMYSEEPDFSGYDQGQVITTSLTITIQNLTPGRTYYLRVAARNQNGLGSYCPYTDQNCLTAVTPVSAVAK
jgi:hypothetical protein